MISWDMAAKAYYYYEGKGEYIRADAIRALMIHALPPQEKAVYDYIKAHPWVTTPAMGLAFGMPLNLIGTICARLRHHHLVHNQLEHDVTRKWSARPNRAP